MPSSIASVVDDLACLFQSGGIVSTKRPNVCIGTTIKNTIRSLLDIGSSQWRVQFTSRDKQANRFCFTIDLFHAMIPGMPTSFFGLEIKTQGGEWKNEHMTPDQVSNIFLDKVNASVMHTLKENMHNLVEMMQTYMSRSGMTSDMQFIERPHDTDTLDLEARFTRSLLEREIEPVILRAKTYKRPSAAYRTVSKGKNKDTGRGKGKPMARKIKSLMTKVQNQITTRRTARFTFGKILAEFKDPEKVSTPFDKLRAHKKSEAQDRRFSVKAPVYK